MLVFSPADGQKRIEEYVDGLIPALLWRTCQIRQGHFDVNLCDYRGIPGYDRVIAVEVMSHGHQVDRFNVQF